MTPFVANSSRSALAASLDIFLCLVGGSECSEDGLMVEPDPLTDCGGETEVVMGASVELCGAIVPPALTGSV